MRTVKPPRRTAPVVDPSIEALLDGEAYDAYEGYDIVRVLCPDCGQSIALLAEEERLPGHALCATAWDPFGLTVCQGSGRLAADAEPPQQDQGGPEREALLLLTLPAGLDWRMQPFSHVGASDARPMPAVELRPGA